MSISRSDWKEPDISDDEDDFDLMTELDEFRDQQEEEAALATNGQSTNMSSPSELQPEEVRKMMEAEVSPPSSDSDVLGKSIVSAGESITPSFVTVENPSMLTNGSSLSNSSSEGIFENASNMIAALTRENHVLKDHVEENKLIIQKNVEIWKGMESAMSIRQAADKKKYEESRQLVLSLKEENEGLKTHIADLEHQLEEMKPLMTSLNRTEGESNVNKDWEAQLEEKETSLKRLKTLLEDNEALLRDEKLQTEKLKELLRDEKLQNDHLKEVLSEHESKVVARDWMADKQKYELDLTEAKKQFEARLIEEKQQYELKTITVNKDIQNTKDAFFKNEEISAQKTREILSLRKHLEEAQAKVSVLTTHKMSDDRDMETKHKTLERLQNTCDELEEELRKLKEELRAAQSEKIYLTTMVAAMTAENEQVLNLRNEKEAYHVDYLQEREARSKVEDERAALLQELVSVREQLMKRQDELDELHKTHLVFAQEHVNSLSPREASMSPSHTPASSISKTLGGKVIGFIREEFLGIRNDEAAAVDANLQAAAAASPLSFGEPVPVQNPSVLSSQVFQPCPLCSKKFDNLSKLQRHAAICGLDEDSMGFTDPFVFP